MGTDIDLPLSPVHRRVRMVSTTGLQGLRSAKQRLDSTATFACSHANSLPQRVSIGRWIEIESPFNATARVGGLRTFDHRLFGVCNQYTLRATAFSRAIIDCTVPTPGSAVYASHRSSTVGLIAGSRRQVGAAHAWRPTAESGDLTAHALDPAPRPHPGDPPGYGGTGATPAAAATGVARWLQVIEPLTAKRVNCANMPRGSLSTGRIIRYPWAGDRCRDLDRNRPASIPRAHRPRRRRCPTVDPG